MRKNLTAQLHGRGQSGIDEADATESGTQPNRDQTSTAPPARFTTSRKVFILNSSLISSNFGLVVL